MTENDGVRESSKNFYISIIYQEATSTVRQVKTKNS